MSVGEKKSKQRIPLEKKVDLLASFLEVEDFL